MEKKFNILITGASRGIGKAIANRLAKHSGNLLITSKQEETLQQALSLLQEKVSGNLFGFYSDHNFAQEAAKNIAEWAASKIDTLDVLVLNAGMFIEGELCGIDNESFTSNMEVNMMVNFYLVKELIHLMKKSEYARIIITGSTAAYEAYPAVPTYGVAKWALRGYAINLRKELAKDSIGVTFIAPGGTWTDMWEGEDLPADRLLEADDIAKVVENLLTLSTQAVVEELIIRPMLGDFHE